MGRAWWRAALVLVGVLVADQLTKRLVRGSIGPGDADSVLPGIQLVHVRNTGIAFGFLGGGGVLVVALVAAALALLVAYFLRHPERPLLWLPTGMLLGGAIGNLADRLSAGAVTDFIKVPLWPAFNVADVSITLGVLALVYVLEGKRPTRGDRA